MNPPKMPIHIGDYKRDTGHLRAAGHGAYLLLLFHHWSTGELPDDDDQLSAIACMTKQEWAKAKPILAKFFEPGWVHDRVIADLAESQESYEKLSKAGKLGAEAKKKRRKSDGASGAISTATSDVETTNNLPLTFNQSKKDAATAAPPKLSVVPDAQPMTRSELERSYFERGKQILGRNAGGLLTKLVSVRGSLELARASIEIASDKQNPREYIGAVLRNGEPSTYVDPRL